MTTITVTIWHNVARDHEGRHTGMLDGYQPGDPMVRVFTYQAEADGRSPEAIAEEAYATCNGHPSSTAGAELAERYYRRGLRSLSAGDLVAVGEAALIVERTGWAPLRGRLTEVRIHEHGTHPLPACSRIPDRPESGRPGPPAVPSREETTMDPVKAAVAKFVQNTLQSGTFPSPEPPVKGIEFHVADQLNLQVRVVQDNRPARYFLVKVSEQL